jgi:hypothetical protein
MKKTIVAIILISGFIISCGSNSDSYSYNATYAKEAALETMEEALDDAMETSEENYREEENVEVKERKLIKEGNISFETDDLKATRDHVFKTVKAFKGYVSSDNEHKYRKKISQTLTVRVPAAKFDDFLKAATKGVGTFDNRSIDVRDVTEEFVDVEARLKAKKQLEARYLELLKEAKNVTEMLEVEREIGKLRSEIESIEGRFNYLKNRVGFSTLNITFYEKIAGENKYASRFSDAFRNGWQGLIFFFIGLINAWPFLIMIGVGLYFVRRWWKRKHA